jgi:hypothetical protein
VAFSPCGGGANANIPTGVLIGQLVTIPVAAKITGLGMIGNPGGGTAIMALYENTNGTPSVFLAQSAEATIGKGVNVLIMPTMSMPAGSYWVMAEFSTTSVICNDGGTSNTIIYGSEGFGTLPASFLTVQGGPQSLTNTVAFNFFVVASD